MFELTRYTRTCHYFWFGPLIQFVLLPMHILVLFLPGLSNLSVLILLATPLIVLGAVVLLLLLKLTYHLSLLRRRATGVVTVISFISKCLIAKRERPLLAWRPLFHKLPFSLVFPFFSPYCCFILITMSLSTTYYHVWALAVLFIDLSQHLVLPKHCSLCLIL